MTSKNNTRTVSQCAPEADNDQGAVDFSLAATVAQPVTDHSTVDSPPTTTSSDASQAGASPDAPESPKLDPDLFLHYSPIWSSLHEPSPPSFASPSLSLSASAASSAPPSAPSLFTTDALLRLCSYLPRSNIDLRLCLRGTALASLSNMDLVGPLLALQAPPRRVAAALTAAEVSGRVVAQRRFDVSSRVCSVVLGHLLKALLSGSPITVEAIVNAEDPRDLSLNLRLYAGEALPPPMATAEEWLQMCPPAGSAAAAAQQSQSTRFNFEVVDDNIEPIVPVPADAAAAAADAEAARAMRLGDDERVPAAQAIPQSVWAFFRRFVPDATSVPRTVLEALGISMPHGAHANPVQSSVTLEPIGDADAAVAVTATGVTMGEQAADATHVSVVSNPASDFTMGLSGDSHSDAISEFIDVADEMSDRDTPATHASRTEALATATATAAVLTPAAEESEETDAVMPAAAPATAASRARADVEAAEAAASDAAISAGLIPEATVGQGWHPGFTSPLMRGLALQLDVNAPTVHRLRRHVPVPETPVRGEGKEDKKTKNSCDSPLVGAARELLLPRLPQSERDVEVPSTAASDSSPFSIITLALGNGGERVITRSRIPVGATSSVTAAPAPPTAPAPAPAAAASARAAPHEEISLPGLNPPPPAVVERASAAPSVPTPSSTPMVAPVLTQMAGVFGFASRSRGSSFTHQVLPPSAPATTDAVRFCPCPASPPRSPVIGPAASTGPRPRTPRARLQRAGEQSPASARTLASSFLAPATAAAAAEESSYPPAVTVAIDNYLLSQIRAHNPVAMAAGLAALRAAAPGGDSPALRAAVAAETTPEVLAAAGAIARLRGAIGEVNIMRAATRPAAAANSDSAATETSPAPAPADSTTLASQQGSAATVMGQQSAQPADLVGVAAVMESERVLARLLNVPLSFVYAQFAATELVIAELSALAAAEARLVASRDLARARALRSRGLPLPMLPVLPRGAAQGSLLPTPLPLRSLELGSERHVWSQGLIVHAVLRALFSSRSSSTIWAQGPGLEPEQAQVLAQMPAPVPVSAPPPPAPVAFPERDFVLLQAQARAAAEAAAVTAAAAAAAAAAASAAGAQSSSSLAPTAAAQANTAATPGAGDAEQELSYVPIVQRANPAELAALLAAERAADAAAAAVEMASKLVPLVGAQTQQKTKTQTAATTAAAATSMAEEGDDGVEATAESRTTAPAPAADPANYSRRHVRILGRLSPFFLWRAGVISVTRPPMRVALTVERAREEASVAIREARNMRLTGVTTEEYSTNLARRAAHASRVDLILRHTAAAALSCSEEGPAARARSTQPGPLTWSSLGASALAPLPETHRSGSASAPCGPSSAPPAGSSLTPCLDDSSPYLQSRAPGRISGIDSMTSLAAQERGGAVANGSPCRGPRRDPADISGDGAAGEEEEEEDEPVQLGTPVPLSEDTRRIRLQYQGAQSPMQQQRHQLRGVLSVVRGEGELPSSRDNLSSSSLSSSLSGGSGQSSSESRSSLRARRPAPPTVPLTDDEDIIPAALLVAEAAAAAAASSAAGVAAATELAPVAEAPAEVEDAAASIFEGAAIVSMGDVGAQTEAALGGEVMSDTAPATQLRPVTIAPAATFFKVKERGGVKTQAVATGRQGQTGHWQRLSLTPAQPEPDVQPRLQVQLQVVPPHMRGSSVLGARSQAWVGHANHVPSARHTGHSAPMAQAAAPMVQAAATLPTRLAETTYNLYTLLSSSARLPECEAVSEDPNSPAAIEAANGVDAPRLGHWAVHLRVLPHLLAHMGALGAAAAQGASATGAARTASAPSSSQVRPSPRGSVSNDRTQLSARTRMLLSHVRPEPRVQAHQHGQQRQAPARAQEGRERSVTAGVSPARQQTEGVVVATRTMSAAAPSVHSRKTEAAAAAEEAAEAHSSGEGWSPAPEGGPAAVAAATERDRAIEQAYVPSAIRTTAAPASGPSAHTPTPGRARASEGGVSAAAVAQTPDLAPAAAGAPVSSGASAAAAAEVGESQRLSSCASPQQQSARGAGTATSADAHAGEAAAVAGDNVGTERGIEAPAPAPTSAPVEAAVSTQAASTYSVRSEADSDSVERA